MWRVLGAGKVSNVERVIDFGVWILGSEVCFVSVIFVFYCIFTAIFILWRVFLRWKEGI